MLSRKDLGTTSTKSQRTEADPDHGRQGPLRLLLSRRCNFVHDGQESGLGNPSYKGKDAETWWNYEVDQLRETVCGHPHQGANSTTTGRSTSLPPAEKLTWDPEYQAAKKKSVEDRNRSRDEFAVSKTTGGKNIKKRNSENGDGRDLLQESDDHGRDLLQESDDHGESENDIQLTVRRR